MHLKKTHKCRFPGHYAAMFSLIGVLFGLLTSLITIYLLELPIFNKLMLIALATFLIIGRTIGTLIDSRVFKNRMQL
jgi:hypothetical protein